jgi:hypothetical protein
MTAEDRRRPVRSYADPRIEIYAPRGPKPYYRLVMYDMNATDWATRRAGRR